MLNHPHRQRGAGALAFTLLLLFGSSIIVFYLNRSLIFEQKTSANVLRSTAALEVAEAGIEWATGMLNNPFDINTSCNFLTTTNVSFRRKYMQPNYATSTDAAPVLNVYPGCKMNGTTLTCGCPDAPASANSTATASLGTDVLPGFTVAFSAVPKNPTLAATGTNLDPEAVRITATGCTATASACGPGTTAGGSGPDAVASVSVIVKLRPILRAAPAAALTCGNNCAPGGSYNIINTDVSTNGILINAGGTVTQGNGVTATSLPGVPGANAVLANDSSLSALYTPDPTCTNSNMFSAYFGSTIAEYAAAPSTKVIGSCGQANTCGGLVNTAYNDGWRSFYFPDGFALNNSAPFSALGSSADPVTLVTPRTFDINGNISIYGMVFSNSANVNDFGTGTADIYGAIVVCGNQSSNGNGTIQYDGNALKNTRRSTALAVRVAGSWTDACTVGTPSGNPKTTTLTCN